jgi:hypothetical protein
LVSFRQWARYCAVVVFWSPDVGHTIHASYKRGSLW